MKELVRKQKEKKKAFKKWVLIARNNLKMDN